MITYGYQQQLYKLRPFQIISLAFLTCCDFILIASLIASIVFNKWSDLAWTILCIAISLLGKIATTFCMKKISYKYSDGAFEVRIVFPYYSKTIFKCISQDIKELDLVFNFANHREESENGKNQLSKMQNNIVSQYCKSRNINVFVKAFINSCPQDIYMLKLSNDKVYFVAIDEFMKSLICNYEQKIQ